MVALGVKEIDTFDICRKYNMLSPLYNMGVGRDGCFFCPNAGNKEREILKNEYPEMAKKIYEMIAKTNVEAVLRLQFRNNWIKDYLANNGDLKKPETKKSDNQIAGQMSIFDFIDN